MATKIKPPRKPKASAPLKSWQNYEEKMKAYDKRLKEREKAKSDKERIIKKYK